MTRQMSIFDSEKTKKRNISSTSRESFKKYNSSGQRSRELLIVLDAIKKNQPVTSRALVQITKIERTNLTRLLFDIVNAPKPLAKVAFDAKCKTTKKTVHHYALIDFVSEKKSQV